MSIYIKKNPSHSGLTALLGGENEVYYHVGPNQFSFLNALHLGQTAVSATTIFSGNVDISRYMTGGTGGGTSIRVLDGVGTYTGGTPENVTVNLVNDPRFSNGMTIDGVEIEQFVINNGNRLNFLNITEDYTINDNSACVILCDLRINNITVSLPNAASAEGLFFIIKDSEGLSETMNLTVLPRSGQLIDRRTDYQIRTPFESITVFSNKQEWSIISDYKYV